jgi:exodeoxyribonuclease VII small subunit
MTAEPELPDDIRRLTYEAALAELDTLIGRLEAGSIALDDAVSAYERGARLARHCEVLLDRTERRISALVIGADGSLGEVPLADAEPEPPVNPPGPTPVAGTLRRPQARAVDPDDVPF